MWLETGRTPARGAAGGHFRGALKAMGRSLDFVVMRCKATAGLRDGSDVFWFVFYRNPSVCVYKIDSREEWGDQKGGHCHNPAGRWGHVFIPGW